MRRLFTIDLKDYREDFRIFRRPSARAIIRREGKLRMVYSPVEKYYKFPGGGIRGNEDRIDTLIREVREETGLMLIPMTVGMDLSEEAFRANAEMYMQKLGNVDPLTLTVKDQDAFRNIVYAIYHDAMGVVMMVMVGLMVLGIILTLSFEDIKKQKVGNINS